MICAMKLVAARHRIWGTPMETKETTRTVAQVALEELAMKVLLLSNRIEQLESKIASIYADHLERERDELQTADK